MEGKLFDARARWNCQWSSVVEVAMSLDPGGAAPFWLEGELSRTVRGGGMWVQTEEPSPCAVRLTDGSEE